MEVAKISCNIAQTWQMLEADWESFITLPFKDTVMKHLEKANITKI